MRKLIAAALVAATGCSWSKPCVIDAGAGPAVTADQERRTRSTQERELALAKVRLSAAPFATASAGDWWVYQVRGSDKMDHLVLRVFEATPDTVVVGDEAVGDKPGKGGLIGERRLFDRYEQPSVALFIPSVAAIAHEDVAIESGVEDGVRVVAGAPTPCRKLTVTIAGAGLVVASAWTPVAGGPPAVVTLDMGAETVVITLVGKGTGDVATWGETPAEVAPRKGP